MDHHRPRFHIRPDVGLVNDPNGPVVVDGVAHLYFQYRVPIVDTAFVLWGHATSDDLVRWRLHRPALVPSPSGADAGGCWSGNTVAREGRITAFYSGFREDSPYQSVLAADSVDGGATYGAARAAVPDPAPAEGVVTWRDPFVWRQHDGWWMVVGAGEADGSASARLFRSDDLEGWTAAGALARVPRGVVHGGAGPGAPGIETGAMWECPQVLSVGGEDVLLACPWAQQEWFERVVSIRGVRVGGADPGPLTIRRLDAGTSFYAPSVLRDGPGGPVVWGWVPESRSPAQATAAGWSGTVSLPRSVRLGDDGSLLSEPLAAVAHLRQEALETAGPLGAQTEVEVRAAAPATVRLVFGPADAADAEALVLRLDPAAGLLELDRSAAGVDTAAFEGTALVRDAFAPGDAGLRLFLDGSVVEVFTSGGRVATTRVYPTAPPPWRLEVEGGAEVAAWRLEA